VASFKPNQHINPTNRISNSTQIYFHTIPHPQTTNTNTTTHPNKHKKTNPPNPTSQHPYHTTPTNKIIPLQHHLPCHRLPPTTTNTNNATKEPNVQRNTHSVQHKKQQQRPTTNLIFNTRSNNPHNTIQTTRMVKRHIPHIQVTHTQCHCPDATNLYKQQSNLNTTQTSTSSHRRFVATHPSKNFHESPQYQDTQ